MKQICRNWNIFSCKTSLASFTTCLRLPMLSASSWSTGKRFQKSVTENLLVGPSFVFPSSSLDIFSLLSPLLDLRSTIVSNIYVHLGHCRASPPCCLSSSILKLHRISREERFLADNVRILAPRANVLASPIITHSQIFLLEPLHKDKIQIHSLVASDVQLLETLINQCIT